MRAADLVTYASVAFGVVAFWLVTTGDLFLAAMFLLGAVLADFLDGKVARRFEQADRFGEAMDSLADTAVFGMVPVASAFVLLHVEWWLLVAAVAYVCAGVFRLARFMTEKTDGFRGMPITLNGIGFAGMLLFVTDAGWYALYFLVSAVLMASRFRVRKL